ncbi:MAG: hypothetical protein M3O23_06870, partial [Actinomycetota bacterium]|nr:hypothetical protein [Actinomycetota bacterium]
AGPGPRKPTPGGLLGRVYGNPGETSRAERERQAAMEFEQAVAPVMDMLVGSIAGASSPEEAARAWESRAGEVRPDPGAGAYIPGDAYEREARVYYRLLRRGYQKNPRPSLVDGGARRTTFTAGTTSSPAPRADRRAGDRPA